MLPVESSDTICLLSFTVFFPVSFPFQHHHESLSGLIPFKRFIKLFLTWKIICCQAVIELCLGRETQKDAPAPARPALLHLVKCSPSFIHEVFSIQKCVTCVGGCGVCLADTLDFMDHVKEILNKYHTLILLLSFVSCFSPF